MSEDALASQRYASSSREEWLRCPDRACTNNALKTKRHRSPPLRVPYHYQMHRRLQTSWMVRVTKLTRFHGKRLTWMLGSAWLPEGSKAQRETW